MNKNIISMDLVPHKVLLPAKLFEQAEDNEHLKMLVLEYMQRYEDYVVKSIKNSFAECERK